jgi:hypothetical protein
VTGLATIMVAVTTLTDGWWLLTALVPYALCVIAYHGAVSVAHAYGIAMRRLVDLNRFSLYEALHLGLPASTDEEKVTGAIVTTQLSGKERKRRSCTCSGMRWRELRKKPQPRRSRRPTMNLWSSTRMSRRA